MSEVTAVPLRPIAKGSLVTLWVGIGLAIAAGVGMAWYGTRTQVAMAQPPVEFLAANAKRSGVVTTASGLQYQVLKEGTGPKPGPNDMVLVEYEGSLANGESFDSSKRQGGPVPLPVAGGMIPPNAITIFDVELVAIAPPQAGMGMGMGAMPEGHGDMGDAGAH
jgi:hypothetical protein